MLSAIAAYGNSHHGRTLAFVVLLIAFGTPLTLLACGYFHGPAPTGLLTHPLLNESLFQTV